MLAALVATSLVLLVGCGSGDSPELDAGGSSVASVPPDETVAMGDPTPSVVPSAIGVGTAPSELWPTDIANSPIFYLAPAGGDRYVMGAQSTDQSGWGSQLGWFLGQPDGSFEPIDPPAVDGVVQEGGLESADGYPLFAALICPDVQRLEEPAEPGTDCAGGYSGVVVQQFDPEGRVWSEVAMLDPGAFGIEDPENMTLVVVGVAANRLYIRVGSGSYASDLYAFDVKSAELTLITEIGAGTYVKCVTADEQVVAILDDAQVTEEVIDFERVTGEGVVPQLAWSASGSEFVAVGESPGGLAGCGVEAAVAVGSRAPLTETMRLEWMEVVLRSGELLAERALPPAMQPRETSEAVTIHFVGEGSADLGLVVGLSQHSTEASRVAILTTVNAEPLVHDFEGSGGADVRSAARLESGEIVVLTAETLSEGNRMKILTAR